MARFYYAKAMALMMPMVMVAVIILHWDFSTEFLSRALKGTLFLWPVSIGIGAICDFLGWGKKEN